MRDSIDHPSFFKPAMNHYRIITVTPFAQNCTLLWCPEIKSAVVIDPGGDVADILSAIKEEGVKVEQILLTHGHIDHVGGAAELSKALGAPVVGPQEEDAFWLAQLPQQSQMFGFPVIDALTPDRWLNHGDTITVGTRTLEVIHTPGHTPGHVVFADRAAKLAIVGDVLFAGSIGRTDFPRGNYESLMSSIRERLWPLGNDTVFLPGHGPASTFGVERKSNPFVHD